MSFTEKFRISLHAYGKNTLRFLQWLLFAVLLGCAGGCLGTAFHVSVDFVTELRASHDWILFLLPLAGCAIGYAYTLTKTQGIGTDRVLESVLNGRDVPLRLLPMIFISSVLTHFAGGSAGREGAALQLGGTLGYAASGAARLDVPDKKTAVICGMASVFSALFGTPAGAAVFALEVTRPGLIPLPSLVPCLVSSVAASLVANLLGVAPTRITIPCVPDVTALTLLSVLLLALLAACVARLFVFLLHKCEHLFGRFVSPLWLRGLIGGAVLLGLTFLSGTRDYNGAGMSVIARAISGEAVPAAFLLKILFTVITISAGFKGGEVVPSFFIGATFGCVAGPLLGLPAGFSAAIGMMCVFCGATNCPIASLLLALEIFGTGTPFFALACAASFLFSGRCSLYAAQRPAFPRFSSDETRENAD